MLTDMKMACIWFALTFCGTAIAADTKIVFKERFITRDAGMNAQRAEQKENIRRIINAASLAESQNRFGRTSDGLSVGLFILEPDNVTISSMYAALVLWNQTPDPVTFWGTMDHDIFALNAIGVGNHGIERTREGEFFGDSLLIRDGRPVVFEQGPPKKVTLQGGTQFVYEINLANVFKFKPNEEVVLTATGRLRDPQYNITRELRSENVIVVPKEKSSKASLFDGPHIPAEYMKYATNRPMRNEPPPNPADAIKTRLPHPPSQLPAVADRVKTAPSGEGVGKGRTATNKVTEPPRSADQDYVENPAGSSQTKYFLAGTVLALLVIGGFLLRRR